MLDSVSMKIYTNCDADWRRQIVTKYRLVLIFANTNAILFALDYVKKINYLVSFLPIFVSAKIFDYIYLPTYLPT